MIFLFRYFHIVSSLLSSRQDRSCLRCSTWPHSTQSKLRKFISDGQFIFASRSKSLSRTWWVVMLSARQGLVRQRRTRSSVYRSSSSWQGNRPSLIAAYQMISKCVPNVWQAFSVARWEDLFLSWRQFAECALSSVGWCFLLIVCDKVQLMSCLAFVRLTAFSTFFLGFFAVIV